MNPTSPPSAAPSALISIEPELGSEEVQELFNQLAISGERHSPPRNYRPLNLVMRDGAGIIRGGLLGSIAWDWLQIDLLWVEETFRGHGFGRELLELAEACALNERCRHARLDSFDFGAIPLYEKLGYVIYGSLEGFPAGHTQYFLRKTLGPPVSPSDVTKVV
ncbi:GNAT family N-acetyltransferase [Verrucomicrobium sp. BvORR034]|jgi:GNAT superfamily N-acetyltransferase|uniref:GNAT family N-acetyltransferase n=1 Tax=Verrucomicrobium sp. BvORR034 TaxID=1396418 RepID=UPI0006792C4A|nr:GNAT family N-acetyltransferase [Verrucomicrobium sp. BvORR034]